VVYGSTPGVFPEMVARSVPHGLLDGEKAEPLAGVYDTSQEYAPLAFSVGGFVEAPLVLAKPLTSVTGPLS
jgi:hypothetical protein